MPVALYPSVWSPDAQRMAINVDEQYCNPPTFMINPYRSDGLEPVRTLRSEPDCYPHPFDIMALYAIYQTVD